MNIKGYIKRLVPAIERKDVVNNITSLREEAAQETLLICGDIVEALKGNTYQGATAKKLANQLRIDVRGVGNDPLVVTQRALANLPALLDIMETRARKLFSFQISTFNITYDRANFLRLVDAMEFYIHVHRRMVLRILQEEARIIGNAKPANVTKGFQLFVDDNMKSYAALTAVFLTPPNEFASKLDKVSNAEITDETFDVAQQTLGRLGTDPFMLESRFMPPEFRPMNPFFSLGKARAERQVRRYKLMKEEIQALQLRLQELRELKENGNSNPKLQKLIDYSEKQLDDLNYSVTTFEESVQPKEAYL